MTRFNVSLATALLGFSILLSACGGGGSGAQAPAPAPAPTPGPTPTSTFSIGGSIVGLGAASGLTLINNGSEKLAIFPNATAFTFVNPLADNASYGVTIGAQPTGLKCSIANATGTVQRAAVASVAVVCTPEQGKSPNTVSTFAGDDGQTYVDGFGAAVRFGELSGLGMDGAGNMYVSDSASSTIRKISPSGVVTTLAGGTTGYADGTGTAARFNGPSSLAVDNSGNVYVADLRNAAIRKITPSGVVSSFASCDTRAPYYLSKPPECNIAPQGIALDSAGNVYVATQLNNRILKITPSGVVSTLAGSDSQGDASQGFADGTGVAARFNNPSGLTVDSAGNLYVTDIGNYAIRKVTPAGVVTTLFGIRPGWPGYVDGLDPDMQFIHFDGIAVDSAGNMYVGDTAFRVIRKITPAGVVTKVAGDNILSRYPISVGAASMVMDSAGNITVMDKIARAIRVVSSKGVVTTIAGQLPKQAWIDATGTAARFFRPTGVAVDGAGNVYVADSDMDPIRKITPSGAVSTIGDVAESGSFGTTLWNPRFTNAHSVAADSMGTLYVVDIADFDTGYANIRKISPTGVATPLAKITFPQGIAVDGAGTLYITSKNAVLKMPAGGGAFTILAGSADGQVGFVDGLGGVARFSDPMGLTVDGAGFVYVADFSNNAIRKISPQGQVTTVASSGLSFPVGVTLDSVGNVYIAGSSAHFRDERYVHGGLVYKLTNGGVVSTLAGGNSSSHVDGPGATALFKNLTAIAIDGAGNLYLTDDYTIRKLVP